MRVTLKDIATEAGYSISTVSRVLNGSDKISKQVQKHILKCAEKLNYPINRSKIPYYSNGNKSITLVTDFREGEFYSSLFYGYLRAAEELKVNLSLISVTEDPDKVYDAIVDQEQHRCDGIALFIPTLQRNDYSYIIEKLKNSGKTIPIISNGLIQTPAIPTITFDGYSGGHIASEHFAKKNYNPVGIIKGPAGKAESSFRYSGFKDNCQNNNIELSWEEEGNYKFESGYNAFQSFLNCKNKPRAIFISNDLMAKGFCEAAREHNYEIPKDIALLSYDDLPMCQELKPQLSSINTDFYELGLNTLKSLNDLITDKNEYKSSLSFIPVSLSERDSA